MSPKKLQHVQSRINYAAGVFTLLTTEGRYKVEEKNLNHKHLTVVDSSKFEVALKRGPYYGTVRNIRTVYEVWLTESIDCYVVPLSGHEDGDYVVLDQSLVNENKAPVDKVEHVEQVCQKCGQLHTALDSWGDQWCSVCGELLVDVDVLDDVKAALLKEKVGYAKST